MFRSDARRKEKLFPKINFILNRKKSEMGGGKLLINFFHASRRSVFVSLLFSKYVFSISSSCHQQMDSMYRLLLMRQSFHGGFRTFYVEQIEKLNGELVGALRERKLGVNNRHRIRRK